MRETTSALIERLSSQAVPVNPLLSPWLRATALLVPVLGLIAAIALLSGNPTRVTDHLSDPVFTLALAGSLLTGISAFFEWMKISSVVSERIFSGVFT